ncbi:MAG: hypothetical protein KC505_10805 [Myxococcales bacterium]|nr:hypothetical protein [Myxococcales bacterium]USN50050.1 MAG: hypothetical protein H6731_07185 [Myxococcales bacterium]
MLKKYFFFILFVGLSSCSKEEQARFSLTPAHKIVFAPRAFSTPREVLNECNAGIYQFTQGAGEQNFSDIHKLVAKKNSIKGEKCADRAADFFENVLRNSVDSAQSEQRTHSDEVDFDVLIIGAGVHGAILSHVLGINFPNTKVLLIDQADHPAEHFHNYGYRLNSPSIPYDANLFPLSPVSIPEYANIEDVGQKRFPKARQLWNQIIFNLFNSNALVAFNTSIEKIEKLNDNYLVSLKGRLASQALLVKKIVLTTGLGQAVFPNTTATNWMKEQREEAKKFVSYDSPLAKVLNYDELFNSNELLLKQGHSIFEFLAAKKIGVVGAGDSGKIAVEFLSGFAPKEAYLVEGRSSFVAPKRIVWFGQKLSTFDEFKKPANGTKPR